MANAATTLAAASTQATSGGSLAQAVDRWIYVFMAASFIAYTLAGFIPDSLAKIAAVDAGERPPFPLALHAHAVLMGAFLVLLLAQSVLAANGRLRYHRTLGIAAFVLGPALVIVGLILAHHVSPGLGGGAVRAPPDVRPMIEQGLREFDNIMLVQMRVGNLFPIFLAIALAARKSARARPPRLGVRARCPRGVAGADRAAARGARRRAPRRRRSGALSVADAYAALKGKPLRFSPGTQSRYGTGDFIVLAHVIETVTGQRFDELLRARIFAPLGFTCTSFDHASQEGPVRTADVVGRRAAVYRWQGDRQRSAWYLYPEYTYASGGMFSCLADLARWATALDRRTLLTAESEREMATGFRMASRAPASASCSRSASCAAGGGLATAAARRSPNHKT